VPSGPPSGTVSRERQQANRADKTQHTQHTNTHNTHNTHNTQTQIHSSMNILREYDFECLPLIDRQFDQPAVQAAVHGVIAAEMRSFAPSDYLAYLPYPELKFANSAALQGEMARMGKGQSSVPLDMSRYAYHIRIHAHTHTCIHAHMHTLPLCIAYCVLCIVYCVLCIVYYELCIKPTPSILNYVLNPLGTELLLPLAAQSRTPLSGGPR
jgi:hypothetical protein